MRRIPVDSSSIAEVGYDPASSTLEVVFREGGVYRYFGVPAAVFSEFMAADSKGRYFVAEIRNRYGFVRV